jgi:manganese/zinc/iron transport system permease protein
MSFGGANTGRSLIWDILTLQAGYNTTVVVLGAICLGVASGVVGTFTLLRGRAMVSDAIAHSALPGLAFAFILAVSNGWDAKNLLLLLSGAAFSGVLALLCMHLIVYHSRLSEDVAIGASLSVFFGLGIVLLSVIQSLGSGGEGGLHHFIYGQTASMRGRDAETLAYLAATCIFVVFLFLKEFRIICFDPEFSRVEGWPVRGIDAVLMILVVLVTVIGLQTVGILLMIALLTIPATAARFWTEKLSLMLFVSALFGALSGFFGAIASALYPRLPAGAVIVSVAGIFFLFSLCFAPQRGVLAGVIRAGSLRRRVGVEHLLRGLYERGEMNDADDTTPLDLESVYVWKGWGKIERWLVRRYLFAKGYLLSREGEVFFTAEGRREAEFLTRSHRLWEEYRMQFGALAASHVDYSADLAEHVLTPELVSLIEDSLRERDLELEQNVLPSSVHPLGSADFGVKVISDD